MMDFETIFTQKDYESIKSTLQNGSSNINLNDWIADFESFQQTYLLAAIDNGDLKMTKLLIAYGADIEISNKDGISPFLLAVTKGHFEIMEYLHSIGSNIHKTINRENLSAIHIATIHDHYEIVQYLLHHKFPIDTVDKNGNSALHYSVKNDNMHISQLLVQHRIDINLINHTDGQSALHLATIQQNVKMICLLLQSHAWPFIPDKNRILPLYYTTDQVIRHYLQEAEEWYSAHYQECIQMMKTLHFTKYAIQEFTQLYLFVYFASSSSSTTTANNTINTTAGNKASSPHYQMTSTKTEGVVLQPSTLSYDVHSLAASVANYGKEKMKNKLPHPSPVLLLPLKKKQKVVHLLLKPSSSSFSHSLLRIDEEESPNDEGDDNANAGNSDSNSSNSSGSGSADGRDAIFRSLLTSLFPAITTTTTDKEEEAIFWFDLGMAIAQQDYETLSAILTKVLKIDLPAPRKEDNKKIVASPKKKNAQELEVTSKLKSYLQFCREILLQETLHVMETHDETHFSKLFAIEYIHRFVWKLHDGFIRK